MSFRALVVPEDPALNGYVLKPLAQSLLAEAGKPHASVKLLTDPRVRGYDEAVRVIRDDLADRYRFFDLWLFFPDADRANDEAMKGLETALGDQEITLLCCPAQPELEIYACAAFRSDSGRGLGKDPRAPAAEGRDLQSAARSARRPAPAGWRPGPDDESLSAEPPAVVSTVPGTRTAARPDRGARPDSLIPCEGSAPRLAGEERDYLPLVNAQRADVERWRCWICV